MNMISDCCFKTTFRRSDTEYPLGGRTWGISYSETACSGCGKDCDEIPACDMCGEPYDLLTHIGGEYCCETCAAEIRRLNPEVFA